MLIVTPWKTRLYLNFHRKFAHTSRGHWTVKHPIRFYCYRNVLHHGRFSLTIWGSLAIFLKIVKIDMQNTLVQAISLTRAIEFITHIWKKVHWELPCIEILSLVSTSKSISLLRKCIQRWMRRTTFASEMKQIYINIS